MTFRAPNANLSFAMLRGLAVLWCASIVALQPSCNSGKCGTGTLRYGDECVIADPFDKTPPVLTIDPALYTRHVGTVHITSDKPATIYYTLDGNPATTDSASGADEVVIPDVPDNGVVLRTFAIDLAGNKSDEIVRVWVIDQDGPGSPTDFHLTLGADNASRTVTWGMPPDPRPGGMLVARVEGKLSTHPISGQTYNVGDTLAGGVTVVAIAKPDPTGMFSETLAADPGLVRYVAWAFDDLDNYGPPAGDYALVPMPAQTATLTINQATGAVTVTSAPATLNIIANASLTTGTLTLNLSLKNTTTRPLFAPKIELLNSETLPAGIAWADSDGMLDAVKYRAYGASLNAGQSNTEAWTFTGLTTGTLTLQLRFRDDPVLTTSASYQGPSIVDSATGIELTEMPAGTPGKESDNRTTIYAFTPEGNLVVGQREACQIISYNIGSSRELARVDLCMQFGHVPWLVADHSGSVIYAVASNSRPKVRYHVAPVDTQLVRLDAATLTEYGPRIELGQGMTRQMKLSPDDKTLIIATGVTTEGLIVVDTTSFKIRTRIKPDFKVQACAFAPDGKSIAALGDSSVAIYDLAGNMILKRPAPGTIANSENPRMMVGFTSPHVIWFSRIGEVDSLDLLTGDSQTFNYTGTMFEVFDGKVYTQQNYSNVVRIDAGGNVEMTFPGLATSGRGHWIGRSPF